MKDLPSPDKLAELVSNVTQTMLGITFKPSNTNEAAKEHEWRTAVLPIDGGKPLVVGLSSDEPGCKALSSAMFACGAHEVDSAMMNDSLCELVNMTAGLLRSAMCLDQALGLPSMLSSSEEVAKLQEQGARRIKLKASEIGMILWIHEGRAQGLNTMRRAG